MEIYLDNASTTKVDKEVLEEIKKYYKKNYGNASSIHSKGQKISEILTQGRRKIAESINSEKEEIIFTSGGTESNNLAIKGVAFANKNKGNHIITTKIEHKSVLESCKYLEKQGFKIDYLDVDNEGFINLNELKEKINEKTILVSIIHGHNEIGTIQDIDEIGKICKDKKVYFHIDACQSFLKEKINVKNFNVDLVSINSHKIHGPMGVGVLYIKTGTKIESLFNGGNQEFGLRAGTENIPGIVGFVKAIEEQQKVDLNEIRNLRDYMIKKVLEIPESKLNGPKERLCNNANFSFKKIEGESIVGLLDGKKIFVSTGSACSEKDIEPSYVLSAIGLSHEEANGSIRVTLSKYNTIEEIDKFVDELNNIVIKLRRISPL